MYTFRKLTSADIFPVCGILKKIGIKEIKTAFKDNDISALMRGGKVDVEAVGMGVMMDIIGIVISNIPSCEKEIYTFVSSITGMKVEELKALKMAEFTDIVIQIIQLDDFKDFFKVAFKSFK